MEDDNDIWKSGVLWCTKDGFISDATALFMKADLLLVKPVKYLAKHLYHNSFISHLNTFHLKK